MNPHHIESIHQLPAGRVRGMVGIGKLPLIHNNARLRIRRDIIIPARHGAWLVHLRQEFYNRILNGICPAESSDDSFFGKRVRLLLHLPLHHGLLPAAHRPLRRIPPVLILFQHHIRVQNLPFNIPEHKLPIGRGGRPVHQSAGFIGGIVKQLHADLLRHLPCHRRILIRRNIP